MPSAMAWAAMPVSVKAKPKAVAQCLFRMFPTPFRVVGALDVALLRGLFVPRIDDAVEHDRGEKDQAADHAPHLLPVDGANEIGGGVGVPIALVPSALRIGAERPLHLDSLGRIASDELRRDDLSGRNVVLDPMRERGEYIVLRV